ncbi:MAG: efflux RND transporter periplasmic adaptor subunit [Spirochaetaceae bacterium]|nr:efflux RND transporter periplasmic adaptor subunit [Spirochaetaceae bacterium]
MSNEQITTKDAEDENTAVKKKGKGKIIALLIITLLLIAGTVIGLYFIGQSRRYLSTDNARVTTNLVTIQPSVGGIFENTALYTGRYVAAGELLGWIENSETFFSPFAGLIVRTYTVQNQVIWPMEPLAVVADMGNLHIQANIEETYITRLQLGQAVSVTLDAFGNRQFSGYVAEIGHVTDAAISGNAMFFNTGGTFTKVTQLIPVKINLNDDINLENFIGLNARVRIAIAAPVNRLNNLTAGAVNHTQRWNVHTTLGLIVEGINVNVGDRVSAGQILATLEAADLAYQVQIAEVALRTAEINMAMAEHNHRNAVALNAARATPTDELRQAEFALQLAITTRDQARVMLNAARTAFERAVIRAPSAGTITAIFAREGAVAMGLLFVIEDTVD